MASYLLLSLVRQLLHQDEKTFLGLHPHPWLVWSLGEPASEPIIAPTTVSTLANEEARVPAARDPLAIEVTKGKVPNAFAFGVTIGRTENNDVVLRHEHVSRFHAYVQAQEGRLFLVDASSKNGTFLDGQRLAPGKPAPLPPKAVLSFGQLDAQYFEPAFFLGYLGEKMRG